jgi:adenine-specific DNA-methyltransferase
MYPRLQLLKKLLAKDGAIFISIDDNEQANLKLICDEIFGQKSFVGTIGWESKTKSQNTKTAYNKLQPKMEYILCYGKQKNKRFNLIKIGEKEYPENDEKGEYRTHKIEEMSSEGVRGRCTMIFSILGVNPGEGKQWQLGVETINMYNKRNDLFLYNNKPHIKVRPSDERPSITNPFWGFFSKEIGTGESAKRELNKIFFPNKHGFETVKPKNLIERLIYHESLKNSIILDSFAGSGTTAHAVLNLNKKDGGNRKFILVELEDYANSITSERVKRVAKGYGKGEKKVEGTNGEFDFYELGLPLFDHNQNLNEEVNIYKIREYIWFSETRTPLIETNQASYFLGEKDDSVYYFIYEKNKLTTLDYDTLELIRTKGKQYIIYADNCLLPKDFIAKNNIIFKKIPRDISRF